VNFPPPEVAQTLVDHDTHEPPSDGFRRANLRTLLQSAGERSLANVFGRRSITDDTSRNPDEPAQLARSLCFEEGRPRLGFRFGLLAQIRLTVGVVVYPLNMMREGDREFGSIQRNRMK